MGLYRVLAGAAYRDSLPWEKMEFFWGDERCVPPDDSESCYFQAYQSWLSHVPVPSRNLHRVKGELDPQTAAQEYARELSGFAASGLYWPIFDLVLLGLGADGHTASLFPGSDQTRGVATIAVTANYQDRPARRVSLTPDVFNGAANLVFLATGAEKAAALASTVIGSRDLFRYPAQRIIPTAGQLYWLVDQAAASQLPDAMDGVIITKR